MDLAPNGAIKNRVLTKNGKNILMTRGQLLFFFEWQNQMKIFLRIRPLVYPAAEPKEEVPNKKVAVGLSSCRIERRGS